MQRTLPRHEASPLLHVVVRCGLPIGAQPFGGTQSFAFSVKVTELAPPITVPGALFWGFGPALWVMIGAAVLLNLGSRLEMYAFKKKHQEMMESQGQA